ncbi:hypothetical protein HO173_013268 [Letharia columbiana]|uniref:LysM domain-containing protein n=1 Tax=Letharia columbiana TaxID=112416 RepID=A0A8H6FC93_9LECA|nr:uncharacterized protein HO173_013268 [Letharia columbiana]KAF6223147.1 hypothetical protein HO173_013268 [Letharia columbiana]
MSSNSIPGSPDRMGALILALATWGAMILPAYSQFNMWPSVDSIRLASAMDFSVDCLNAMNTTVTCEPDLFRMAGQVDLYYWVQDNITDLCTPSCIQSSSDWLEGIYNTCDGQTITIDSKMVPVASVAIRYSDGVGLTCLTDVQLPITLSYNQTSGSDPNTTASPISVNGTSTAPGNDSSIPGNGTTVELNNSTFNYCFLDAQNWVGIDITAPDCTLDSSQTLCTDPDAANRIANLYNDTVLCSNCFLSVMWWRINSPFLPDTDESDYLIEQYQDITDVCNVTMPPSLIRALPSYPAAPSPPYLTPGTDPNANLTASISGTCGGQTISRSNSKRDGMEVAERDSELLELENDYSGYARVKRASAGSCDSLSQSYGVTTGDLQSITGNDDCSFSASSICVPLKCEVAQVGNDQSCASIASSLSTSSINVTITLFLQWNPNIIGLCDNLTTDQYICSGPLGGGYTLPAPISGINSNAGAQQRGGQGSGTNPNGPDGPDGPTPNSTTSAPTQLGIAKNCNAYAYADTNSTCYDMSQSFRITLAQLTTWNPVLGYPDGHNCTTQFWAGYDYCVGLPGNSISSSSTSTKSSLTTSSLPYPTKSDITPACDKYGANY